MTTRRELMELLKDLPNDDTWVDAVMQRLKEKAPAIYDHMIVKAKERLEELERNK